MYYVYIMTNKSNSVLYTGVTNNLSRRVWEHVTHSLDGFTKRYNINKLIYFEKYEDPADAITREKQIKSWSRIKKIKLIESVNPDYKDFGQGLL